MTPEPPPAWAIAMMATGIAWAGLIVPMMMVGGASLEQTMPYYVLSLFMIAGGYKGMNQDS